jgi:hypothetical protein
MKQRRRVLGPVVPAIPLVFTRKRKPNRTAEPAAEVPAPEALQNGKRLDTEGTLDTGGKEVVAGRVNGSIVVPEQDKKSNGLDLELPQERSEAGGIF